jgi:hypothetical protein
MGILLEWACLILHSSQGMVLINGWEQIHFDQTGHTHVSQTGRSPQCLDEQ